MTDKPVSTQFVLLFLVACLFAFVALFTHWISSEKVKADRRLDALERAVGVEQR